MAGPDVHQRGGNVNPSERRTCEASFKGLENSMCAPSSRGGVGKYAMCRSGHGLARDGAMA
jgi:hypothetical protein